MPFTAEILDVRPERDKHRVTFHYVDGAQVRGPFVLDRPQMSNEDHLIALNLRAPVEVDERQRLINALAGNGDPTALNNALISEGVDVCFFDGALIRIQGTVTNPRTLQSALVARLGAPTMTRIANKLRAANYEVITSAAIDRIVL